jgi:hypothetical protein
MGQQQWPRTIATKAIGGRQEVVESREQALAYFKASDYRDCRINCYPTFTEYHGIQLHPPNILFVADLDTKDFKTKDNLNRTLGRILKNTSEILNGATPAVIWSGHGYHLILPMEIPEPLELESVFEKYTTQPSIDFLRFAEGYLSMGKTDKQHCKTVSFKNYLTRIPGSFNFKCLDHTDDRHNNGLLEKRQQVKLIREWNGVRPTIRGKLLREFHKDLVDKYVKIKNYDNKRSKKQKQNYYVYDNSDSNNNFLIQWIETGILQNPLSDYRKTCIWRILAPYLINIRKLEYAEAFNLMKGWLDRCNEVKRLDFNPKAKIKEAMDRVGNYYPIALDDLSKKTDLKREYRELYDIIKRRL